MDSLRMKYNFGIESTLHVDGSGWLYSSNDLGELATETTPSFDLTASTNYSGSTVTTDGMFAPTSLSADTMVQTGPSSAEVWFAQFDDEFKPAIPEQYMITDWSINDLPAGQWGSSPASNVHAESTHFQYQLGHQPCDVGGISSQNFDMQYALPKLNCQPFEDSFPSCNSSIPYVKLERDEATGTVQNSSKCMPQVDSKALLATIQSHSSSWEKPSPVFLTAASQTQSLTESDGIKPSCEAVGTVPHSPSLPHVLTGFNILQANPYHHFHSNSNVWAHSGHPSVQVVSPDPAHTPFVTFLPEQAIPMPDENHSHQSKQYVHQFRNVVPKPRCGTSQRDKSKDDYLLECKAAGMSYKDIKTEGGFEEAESTLRGRYRALTKPKEARVRKPEWTSYDVIVLRQAVSIYLRSKGGRHAHYANYTLRHGSRAHLHALNKVPWKDIADYMARHGCYHFGNATVKKKYLEVLGIRVNNKDG